MLWTENKEYKLSWFYVTKSYATIMPSLCNLPLGLRAEAIFPVVLRCMHDWLGPEDKWWLHLVALAYRLPPPQLPLWCTCTCFAVLPTCYSSSRIVSCYWPMSSSNDRICSAISCEARLSSASRNHLWDGNLQRWTCKRCCEDKIGGLYLSLQMQLRTKQDRGRLWMTATQGSNVKFGSKNCIKIVYVGRDAEMTLSMMLVI